jgi:hypothetical protein
LPLSQHPNLHPVTQSLNKGMYVPRNAWDTSPMNRSASSKFMQGCVSQYASNWAGSLLDGDTILRNPLGGQPPPPPARAAATRATHPFATLPTRTSAGGAMTSEIFQYE